MDEKYSTPEPRFAKDVHLDATGMWAREVGFDDEMARKISEACNSVDGEWWDEGLRWALKGILNISDNASYYHYMTDKHENRYRDWHLAERIISYRFQSACRLASQGKKEEALIMFGKGLHTYQDRFSHTLSDGSPMTGSEHGLFSGTDNIDRHPEKFILVRKATVEALSKLRCIMTTEYSCAMITGNCSSDCPEWKFSVNPDAPKDGLPEWSQL